jgi:hypothetical protein
MSEKNHQYYTVYYILYTYFWPTLYEASRYAVFFFQCSVFSLTWAKIPTLTLSSRRPQSLLFP